QPAIGERSNPRDRPVSSQEVETVGRYVRVAREVFEQRLARVEPDLDLYRDGIMDKFTDNFDYMGGTRMGNSARRPGPVEALGKLVRCPLDRSKGLSRQPVNRPVPLIPMTMNQRRVAVRGPGTCALFPRNILHAGQNTSSETGRVSFLSLHPAARCR